MRWKAGRINTKGRIAYLGGAHAEGPLLAQSGHSAKVAIFDFPHWRLSLAARADDALSM
jgi:hypothetical protein